MHGCEQQHTVAGVLQDSEGRPLLYRYRTATDDLEVITEMLHEAYAPLAAAGMRFVA